MDRQLRAEIVAEVRKSMTEILEVANERWLTGDELCEQFQMFSKGSACRGDGRWCEGEPMGIPTTQDRQDDTRRNDKRTLNRSTELMCMKHRLF